MKTFFWNTNHGVYSSLIKVFSFSKIEIYQTHKVFGISTTHLENSSFKIDNSNIYITKSPLVSLFTWKLKANSAKAFIFEEYFHKRWIKDVYASTILKLFKAYPFIAMTKRTNKFLKDLGLDSFFIPPAEKKRDYSFKREYITMISRLVPSKNISLFLNLAESLPDYEFLLIGKGPLKKKVIEFARNHSNFRYIEHVEDREDLFKYYAKSKLFIHPPFKDPIGFVIIEALSTSTPVLSSSSAGASDYLPEEWRVNTFDLKLWKREIKNILEDEKLAVEKASLAFKKEHLDINDPYFESIKEDIKKYIKERFG